MLSDPLYALPGLVGIGVLAQWVGSRLRIPAIVLLLATGITLGPVLGVLDPDALLGPLLNPVVALSVSIILFEGGLSLRWSEARRLGAPLLLLVIGGLVVTLAAVALLAHYVAGLSWGTSAVLGSILVVTGPTVIKPMLRHARLARRPALLLKWESIINDPLGALLAVVTLEFAAWGSGAVPAHAAGSVPALIVAAGFFGGGAAWVLGRAMDSGWISEHLKVPAIVAGVLVVFAAAESMYHEAGLLAVTVMGVVLANVASPSVESVRHFKEDVATLLVSFLFLILSAKLQVEHLRSITFGAVLLTLGVLFVVRPLAVWLPLAFRRVPWQEKLLIGWIAPRGVVAAAMGGALEPRLREAGFEDAALLVPILFLVILATVVLHGLTIVPLARRLGLAGHDDGGLLIVGAPAWAVDLARALQETGAEVVLVDQDYRSVAKGRMRGMNVFYGDILSEDTIDELPIERMRLLLAATQDDHYNALVCVSLSKIFGRENLLQVSESKGGEGGESHLRGRTPCPRGSGPAPLLYSRATSPTAWTRAPASIAVALTALAAARPAGPGGQEAGAAPGGARLELEVLGLGRAVAEGDAWVLGSAGIAAIPVRELAQGRDLNGDGDTADTVLYVYQAEHGTLASTGVAAHVPTGVQVLDGAVFFAVSEADEGGVDRNGDGDATDRIACAFDVASGDLVELDLACGRILPSAIGRESARWSYFTVQETDQGEDANGDGDLLDEVLYVHDHATGATADLGLPTALAPSRLDGDRLAFLVDEVQHGADLDGDGDAGETLLVVHDPATGASVPSPDPVFPLFLAFAGDLVAYSTTEGLLGQDLDGDGAQSAFVFRARDLAGGPPDDLVVAPFFEYLSVTYDASPQWIAYNVRESVDASDWNGDGDAEDVVTWVWDRATGARAPAGVAVGYPPWILGERVMLAVRESYDERDHNEDGDITDFVLAAWDPALGSLTSSGLAMAALLPGAAGQSPRRLGTRISESGQGATDWNGDGDASDEVVAVFDPVLGTTAALGLATADAGDGAIGDLLAFGVDEADQAVDLNADGALDDRVLFVAHVATRRPVSSGLPIASRYARLADDVLVDVREADLGRDLTGDGDVADAVLFVVRTRLVP